MKKICIGVNFNCLQDFIKRQFNTYDNSMLLVNASEITFKPHFMF